MRFLCLHGLGTNSNIFEAQTARIREKLGPTCEFVFLDGEFDCDAAPGVSEIFPGPYLGWYPAIPSETELIAAREYVLEVLTEDGPFDGLMGFSQGAALAASVILQHSDPANSLVDCAVFICGTLPWMLQSELSPLTRESNTICQAYDTDGSEDGMEEIENLKLRITSFKNAKVKLSGGSSYDPRQTERNQACLLHPANSPLRFSIPTGYISGGRSDAYFELSKALVDLGSELHGVRTFDHEAGHTIPRREYDTAKMADIVSWAADKVIWRC